MDKHSDIVNEIKSLLEERHTLNTQNNIYFIENRGKNEPGVFILRDWIGYPLFIGKTKNINSALKRFFQQGDQGDLKYVYHNVKSFSYTRIDDNYVQGRIKQLLIDLYHPPFNSKDNEGYVNKYDLKYLLQPQIEYNQKNYFNKDDPFARIFFGQTGIDLPAHIEEKRQKLLDDARDRVML